MGSGHSFRGRGRGARGRVMVGWEGSWRGVRVRSRGCHVILYRRVKCCHCCDGDMTGDGYKSLWLGSMVHDETHKDEAD